MREITTHRVNGLNEALCIQVLDQPGAGGANHRYHVTTVETPPPIGGGMSSEDLKKSQAMAKAVHDIRFQDGPIQEVGVNGISNEVLLAIVADRLACFQAGPFACEENAAALSHVMDAMAVLAKRTRDRVARGVEGRTVA